jgi:Glyoxalase-like domain
LGARTGKIVLALVAFGCQLSAVGYQPAASDRPAFHHLHLNSVDPEAAIAFYTKAFPSTSRSTFAGQPALASPNNVLVLFNKVAAPPATQPHTAFWHFGWHVTDVRAARDRFLRLGITLLPLYTGDGAGTVYVSSDTWPGSGGVLGVTRRHCRREDQRHHAGRRTRLRVFARPGRCAG